MKSKHYNKIRFRVWNVCLFESKVINDGQNIVRINPDCH